MDKSGLLAMIKAERERFLAGWTGMDEERFIRASGYSAGSEWSIKDMVAHVGHWEAHIGRVFSEVLVGKNPERDRRSFDEINREIFLENRDRTAADVREGEAQAFQRLIGLIEGATEEDLFDPKRFGWTNGQPFADWIAGDTYEHYQEHAGEGVMQMDTHESNVRPEPDEVIQRIAEYVFAPIESAEAYATARLSLMDAMGCAMLALGFPACTRLLGPVVPGTIVPNGAHVPGTAFVLDSVQAAFDLGAMIRWLDFNDTFLAAEWGHPSDNLGGILAAADWASRTALFAGHAPFTMRDVLTGMIQAHEIQGGIALVNSFNRVGLDHVLLVRVATAAVGDAHPRGDARAGGERRLQRLDRRRGTAHLPARAQHRAAQVLGGGGRYQPRGTPGAAGALGRDGLSLRAHGQNLGLLRRAVPRAGVQNSSSRLART